MPPGTGDAQLSLAQPRLFRRGGCSHSPGRKSHRGSRGIEMFRTVKVPILGVVENMSYFMGDAQAL